MDPNVEISEKAFRAREELRFSDLRIEHVVPKRALSRLVIDRIAKGETDQELIDFLQNKYRLVVLTKDEMREVDAKNRSQATPDRIAEACITLKRQ